MIFMKTIPGFTAESALSVEQGYSWTTALPAAGHQVSLSAVRSITPALRINPFLARLCLDTAFCLNDPGNSCGISTNERQSLRRWYIENCGGPPDLIA
jgi:hypothetical protein